MSRWGSLNRRPDRLPLAVRILRRLHVLPSFIPSKDFLTTLFDGDATNADVALTEAFRSLPDEFKLIGPADAVDRLAALAPSGKHAIPVHWEFGHPIPPVSAGVHIFAVSPTSESEWDQFRQWQDQLGSNLLTSWGLALPFATLPSLQKLVDFNSDSFSGLCDFYAGRGFSVPVAESGDISLDFKGKSVVEFGPSDGCHTGGIVAGGAARVLCVEARPENVVKLLAARQSFGWNPVEVLPENFHAIHPAVHGRFDIAYAHGVYYHTNAPLHFLENLTRLSDEIYIGGWCASDAKPDVPWEEWKYRGETYRGKTYKEPMHFLSGIQQTSVYLDAESLDRFFEHRGFKVFTVSREQSLPDVTGDFYRFIARR